jgi:hypothetical protein
MLGKCIWCSLIIIPAAIVGLFCFLVYSDDDVRVSPPAVAVSPPVAVSEGPARTPAPVHERHPTPNLANPSEDTRARISERWANSANPDNLVPRQEEPIALRESASPAPPRAVTAPSMSSAKVKLPSDEPKLMAPAEPPKRKHIVTTVPILPDEAEPRVSSLQGGPPSVRDDTPTPATPSLAQTSKPDRPYKTAADQMKGLRKDFDALPMGKIILRAPTNMIVGERESVEARVGVNVTLEALRGGRKSDRQRIESDLRVSSEMIAVLHGSAFDIKPTTPEQQMVAEGLPTVWAWDVEAKHHGENELEATLYALVPTATSPSRQRVDSYTHKVTVSVKEQTWRQWARSIRDEISPVQTVVVALIGLSGAGLGWAWAFFFRRKKPETRSSGKKKKQSRKAAPA